MAFQTATKAVLLASALLLHDLHSHDQHSEELSTVLITICGSVLLVFAHLRNRKLCMQEDYSCHE